MDARTRQFGLAGFMRQAFLWTLLPTLVLFLIAPAVGNAQVPPPITSSGLNTQISDPITVGVQTQYDITGGTRPGGASGTNLFHSFGDFSVGSGDIANFLNDSGLTTTNIIGRVTGGNISNIDGIIQTNGTGGFGNANLFLVNPFGIVFGPQGSVNVGGAVSFTTADYLRHADGTLFNAIPNALPEVLSLAPVATFGFLGSNPAAIAVQGSTLAVLPGQSISLVGGKVVIEAGAQLSAPTGKIQIASTASAGEFDVATLGSLPNVDGASFTSFGTINVAPGSSIDIHGTSTVFLIGGQLVLSVNDATLSTTESPTAPGTTDEISLSQGSSIVTSNSGSEPGADIQITVGTLNLDGSTITTETSGDGNGGNLTADVGTLSLTNFAAINSNNFSFGTDLNGDGVADVFGVGGNVTVEGLAGTGSAAESVTLNNGATLTTQTFGPGKSGDVQISAASVGLDGAFINTYTFGLGNGGGVELNAGTLTIENFSQIVTQTLFGDGAGGDVVLNVGMGYLLSGASILSQTLNFTPEGGQGGKVIIQGLQGAEFGAATSVTLSGGSSVLSETFGVTDGGQVVVTSKSLTMDGVGQGGNSTTITSSAIDVGRGGNVEVNVQQARLLDGATIKSGVGTSDPTAQPGPTLTVQGVQGMGSIAVAVDLLGGGSGITGIISNTDGSVSAGDIAVYAETVTMADGAVIQGGTLVSNGAAGRVIIEADSVNISGGSQILSQASNSAAGQVTITANTITLDNGSITTQTISAGRGGDVVLDVGSASLTNGASINTSTVSDNVDFAGNAGDVKITFSTTGNTVSLASGSSITSATTGAGDAGQVTVTTPNLNMDNAIITTSTSGIGNAGDITATVGMLSLIDGSSISSASTGTAAVTNPDGLTTEPPGTAGNVTIAATGGFSSDASSIATSAEANHGGDISITGGSVQLSNGTVVTASSKAPLEVTKFVLDQDGLPVEVEAVGDDGRSDGNAGSVTITSDSNVVMQNSSVTTEASDASGGSIEIDASDAGMIQLVNSKVSTSVGGVAKKSNGGNITIDPQFVILQNSQIRANANAGAGGAIDIIATSAFITDPSSIVSASSTLGVSGTVNIQSPLQNVGGELAALSQEFSSVGALLAQQCAARAADGKFSTFVIAAREGLPAEPGGFLASPSLTSELLGTRHSGGQTSHNQLSPFTGLFPQYDARPIQLAKFGDSCHW